MTTPAGPAERQNESAEMPCPMSTKPNTTKSTVMTVELLASSHALQPVEGLLRALTRGEVVEDRDRHGEARDDDEDDERHDR